MESSTPELVKGLRKLSRFPNEKRSYGEGNAHRGKRGGFNRGMNGFHHDENNSNHHKDNHQSTQQKENDHDQYSKTIDNDQQKFKSTSHQSSSYSTPMHRKLSTPQKPSGDESHNRAHEAQFSRSRHHSHPVETSRTMDTASNYTNYYTTTTRKSPFAESSHNSNGKNPHKFHESHTSEKDHRNQRGGSSHYESTHQKNFGGVQGRYRQHSLSEEVSVKPSFHVSYFIGTFFFF